MTGAAGAAASGFFSPDYRSARQRFRDLAAARGFALESHSIAGAGPGGEELAIDVARAGTEPARGVVIVSSGLHGVEGYFGAAVQLALLADEPLLQTLPRGVGLVLVHALDPFGFAWIRRTNEENVDLNRNFLIPGESYAGSPARYSALDSLLNPRYPPHRHDLFRLWASLAILRHGMSELKQAVAGGQYDFPTGLFFGGHAPAATYRVLNEQLGRWLGDAGHVLQIDFHSGLGRWATYQLLVDVWLEPARFAWSRAHFGARVVHSDPAASIAYQARGDLAGWLRALFPGRAVDLLCAEFGTYPPLRVLRALRAENQAHFWAPPDHPNTRWAKQQLLEAFVPASPSWRARAVQQGLEIIHRAIAACAESTQHRPG
jgi:hypothetical protein